MFCIRAKPKSLTLTLGTMPNERQAIARNEKSTPANSVPHVGLNLAPSSDVAGSGDKGVVVTGVEPNGPAAEKGFKTGDVILDVGGTTVKDVSDVRQALSDAQAQGKHSVLTRVKTSEGTKFVALPMSNG